MKGNEMINGRMKAINDFAIDWNCGKPADKKIASYEISDSKKTLIVTLMNGEVFKKTMTWIDNNYRTYWGDSVPQPEKINFKYLLNTTSQGWADPNSREKALDWAGEILLTRLEEYARQDGVASYCDGIDKTIIVMFQK